jgi:hypothetical protein
MVSGRHVLVEFLYVVTRPGNEALQAEMNILNVRLRLRSCWAPVEAAKSRPVADSERAVRNAAPVAALGSNPTQAITALFALRDLVDATSASSGSVQCGSDLGVQ